MSATGFLTGKEIEKLKPFEENTYDPDHLADLDKNGKIMYDLRLGSENYVSTKDLPIVLDLKAPYVVIKPGEFALLTTEETLKVPLEVVGFLSLRFRWASKGLINISGFHVDPGYTGKIVFSVYNAGPNDVTMKWKDPVFMIMFAYLTKSVAKPYGEGYSGVPLTMIDAVRGTPISSRDLHNRITTIETTLKLLAAVFVSIIGALVAILLHL